MSSKGNSKVRVRFAPSPTGYMHIGNARTALFNWLYARHCGADGTFILRIEDTDRARSTEEHVKVILDGLSWLGIDWDEGPIYQSQRMDLYRAAALRLVEEGKAYSCYCTPEELQARRAAEAAKGKDREGYDGRCRDVKEPPAGVVPSIRLRTPDSGTTVFEDVIQGRIETDNAEIDDRVILRSDGTPTYNLSVVVDDHDMGITHVIRGADHITNTPVQVLLYEAFGWEPPAFAHQSLILGPDGKKYSKRHGAVAVTEYREMGILSDALFNALLRLGWSHGDQEIFSRAEAVALFDIKDARRAPAIFDTEKLKSTFNHHYLRAGDAGVVRRLLSEQLARLGLAVEADDARLGLLVAPLSDRARTVREMAEQARVLLAPEVVFEEKAQKKHLTPAAAPVLEDVASRLEALPADPTDGDIMACFTGVAEAHGLGMGKVAQPARVAMLGTDRSPGIELVVRVVGIARAAARMRAAAAGARG